MRIWSAFHWFDNDTAGASSVTSERASTHCHRMTVNAKIAARTREVLSPVSGPCEQDAVFHGTVDNTHRHQQICGGSTSRGGGQTLIGFYLHI